MLCFKIRVHFHVAKKNFARRVRFIEFNFDTRLFDTRSDFDRKRVVRRGIKMVNFSRDSKIRENSSNS